MRIWSILIIKSVLKWCVDLSISFFLYFQKFSGDCDIGNPISIEIRISVTLCQQLWRFFRMEIKKNPSTTSSKSSQLQNINTVQWESTTCKCLWSGSTTARQTLSVRLHIYVPSHNTWLEYRLWCLATNITHLFINLKSSEKTKTWNVTKIFITQQLWYRIRMVSWYGYDNSVYMVNRFTDPSFLFTAKAD